LFKDEYEFIQNELHRLVISRNLIRFIAATVTILAAIALFFPLNAFNVDSMYKLGLTVLGSFFFFSINFLNRANIIDLRKRQSELFFIIRLYDRFESVEETVKQELTNACKEKIKKLQGA
jgi:hypothetical protein